MSVLAHGIDLVDCRRLAESVERHGQRFLDRIYTKLEQDYCQARPKSMIQHLAGRFAIKEAVLKVLGTGWTNGIAWTEIEVRNDPTGRPKVVLSGRCRELADQKGITTIHISISHVASHAIGSAIAEGVGAPGALGVLGMS